MVWTHRGKAISLEIYHGVPRGWYAAEIVAEHTRLGGTYDLSGPEATEPGAPSWLPERYAWLQYRAMVRRVGDGVLFGDPACVELAIRYIELRYIGSYSGFLRSLLARRLKHALLTSAQRQRLHRHFTELVLDDERTQEFREYLVLWRQHLTADDRADLLGEVRRARGDDVAQWLAAKLG